MSALRRVIRDPRAYLSIVLVAFVFVIADSFRPPASQFTARLYVSSIKHLYQTMGHALVEDRIQCRYHPTCSNYSMLAVETHGIRHGLVLTLKRLMSCQNSVPLGTLDLVPSLAAQIGQN
jgi:putative membrane protein insertion efficiency factor